jgi:hypothetical protein
MCPLYNHTPSGIKNLISSNYIVSSVDPKMLPVINLKVSRAGKTVVVPFLIDTGAQSSYICLDFVQDMEIDT